MRGVRLDATKAHILVLRSSLDLMLKGTLNLSAPCRGTRAAAAPRETHPKAHLQCEA